jgi:hypothetical protein
MHALGRRVRMCEHAISNVMQNASLAHGTKRNAALAGHARKCLNYAREYFILHNIYVLNDFDF